MEPKVFFANERTFISWLSMAVNLSSISIGVLAFSSRNCTFHRLFKLKLIQFDRNSLALFYYFRYLIVFLIVFDYRFCYYFNCLFNLFSIKYLLIFFITFFLIFLITFQFFFVIVCQIISLIVIIFL